METETLKKHCSTPGCDNSYSDHHWGAKKAQKKGWFLQRSGDAWCPEHVPEWVEEWRASEAGEN